MRKVLVVLLTVATTAGLQADPTSTDKPGKSRDKVESRNAESKVVVVRPLSSGWNYINGEWFHGDGYKYVNGQVVRTAAQTHARPPKAPSSELLNSVKTKPAPTPADTVAAKIAEKERNLRPRPATQTGSHL